MIQIHEQTSRIEETYYHLGIDIEQNTSLYYCLKEYIGKEQLRRGNKFYCDRCNALQEAEKKVILETLPKIVIIQLKRFQMICDKNKVEFRKLSSFVHIPLTMDFSMLLEKGKESQKTLYSLRSIVVHAGSRGEYGHYVTLVKNQENDYWIKFNDEKWSLIEEEMIEMYFGNPDETNKKNTSESAYLLFYEQKNE